MAGLFYYVNGGIKVNGHGQLFFYLDQVADKCALHEALVTGLSFKSAEQKADLELFRKAMSARATATIELLDKRMRYKYKINAVDVEKEINATNNPGLADLLGWVLSNYGGGQNKLPIDVINDVIIGDVLYVLLAVNGAHSYNIECTLISETGDADIVTIRNVIASHGNMTGFVSGAKYRYRSQAVLGNNLFAEFTPAVELRIN